MTQGGTPELRPWTWGLGHQYISLFLSVIFLDGLAQPTLGVGGLGPSLLGAAVGGVLAFGLLFHPSAMWGLRERKGLSEVLAATFGETGARRLGGLAFGLANIAWFAVGLSLASTYGTKGLLALGMIGPEDIAPWDIAGVRLKAPVVLFETLAWGLFAAVMGTKLVRVVSAVMFTYPVFPGLALAFTLIYTLPNVHGSEVLPRVMADPGVDARLVALLAMVQLVCGFCAMPGLMGADWGTISRDARDVRLGGLFGIALAATVLVALSLTIIANTIGPRPGVIETPVSAPATAEERLAALLGKGPAPSALPPAPAEGDSTFALALQVGIGGPLGGALLLVFAMGLLGPCAYAPYHAVRFLGPLVPKAGRMALGIAGAVVAWPLVALGTVDRTDQVFGLMGAIFGPIAGVVAAAAIRSRASESGFSVGGWRWSAVIAWGTGLVVGLLPTIGLKAAQPATLLAWGVAFGVELVLSRTPLFKGRR